MKMVLGAPEHHEQKHFNWFPQMIKNEADSPDVQQLRLRQGAFLQDRIPRPRDPTAARDGFMASREKSTPPPNEWLSIKGCLINKKRSKYSMKTLPRILGIVLSVVTLMIFSGCETEEGPVEKTGEAIEETGEAIEETAEEAGN